MINRLHHCLVGIACSLSVCTPLHAQPDSETDLYERAGRNATITVHCDTAGKELPGTLFGINLSYFNDTDELWSEFGLGRQLERAAIGAMRYPGGEETSYYHWEHPGVNGYEDLFDESATHGMPTHRGPFQVTWVSPDEWDTNESFMDIDEFLAHCEDIGAEPIVGINMSSGRKRGDIQGGIDEALRLVRHAHKDGRMVRYWFLDNEPWHGESNYNFDIEHEYAPDVRRYSAAIKSEFPHAEIIVNPFSAESYNHRDFAVRVIRAMGDSIDHVDVHWYWAWGMSSWERWTSRGDMTTGTQWKGPEDDRPFADDFALLRSIFAEAGSADLGLMALEWNLGPGAEMLPLSETAYALMHAQMLMEFAHGGLEAACLWTHLWRSRREVWPEQDVFPSIIHQQPPFGTTRTHDVFRMMSDMAGGRLVECSTSRQDIRVLASLDDASALRLAIVHKGALRSRVTIDCTGISATPVLKTSAGFSVGRSDLFAPDVDWQGDSMVFFAEPHSFTVITLGVSRDR